MRTLSALSLVVGMAAPAAALGETVALLPATGVNVPADTLAAAQDVFFGHMLATRRWTVTVVRGPAPEGAWPPAGAAQRARQAGADLAVTLHLTGFEGSTTARLAVYRVADGQMAWFDAAAATEPGELDGALQRLARGLASGQPATRLAPPAALAGGPPPAPPAAVPWPPPPGRPPPTPEAVRPRRRAEQSFGFAFLGAWASGADAVRRGDGTAQGVEAFWLYDTRSVLATVRLSYLGGANHQTAFGMGVHVPLLPGDVAPYLGGGLQFTWSRWWDATSWESGFTPLLGAGVLVGREWTVQVRAEVQWFYNLYLSSNAGGSFHGQGLVASVGMAF